MHYMDIWWYLPGTSLISKNIETQIPRWQLYSNSNSNKNLNRNSADYVYSISELPCVVWLFNVLYKYTNSVINIDSTVKVSFLIINNDIKYRKPSVNSTELACLRDDVPEKFVTRYWGNYSLLKMNGISLVCHGDIIWHAWHLLPRFCPDNLRPWLRGVVLC